jgi:hypothetical protein
MSDDAFDQLERTAKKILALIDHLQADNKRLRNQIHELEADLKEIGAVSWRTPDDKAVDADLQREDAHERQRLDKEYPWKE